ncbi:MAG: PAS domain-containing protein [Deltaproteobacteria bacterium]|nr:PAS domain-containing protein [Deltaproteobacteria bacterium]
MRTLVLAREPTAAQSIAQRLTALGHQVDSCGDVSRALAEHEAAPYDLVVADWELVSAEEAEFCHWLWRRPGAGEPVLLFVANAEDVTKLAPLLSSGPSDYLVRPLDPDHLELRLRLAERRAHESLRRRSAEEKLRASEARLQRITDNVPGVVYQVIGKPDGSLTFTYLSDACRTMFGVEPDEVVRNPSSLLSLLHPEDVEGFARSVAESFESLTPWVLEGRAVLHSGETIWFHGASRAQRLPDGRVLWDGVIVDVTEARRAQAELRETHERIDLAVQGSSDGLWELTLEDESFPPRNLQMWFSPRFKELLRCTSDDPETMAAAWYAALHPDDQPYVVEQLRRHLVDRLPFDVEYRLRNIAGDWRWYSARGEAQRHPTSGRAVRVAGSIRDVTDRKQLERQVLQAKEELELRVQQLQQEIGERKRAVASLRESELRFALAASGVTDGLWDWNLATNQVYYSPRWKSMLGHGESEITNSPEEWLSRVHPEDLPEVQAMLDDHLEGRRQHFEQEYRIRHRDGAYRWVLARGLAIRDADMKAVRIGGSQTDITRRRQMEHALRRSETRNRALLNAIPDTMISLTREGRFLDVKPSPGVTLVAEPNEVLGLLLEETSLPSSLIAAAREALGRTLDSGTLASFEYHLPASDGTRYFEARMVPSGDDETLTIIRNITERKRAEEALRETLERFDLAIQGANDALWDVKIRDLRGFTDANEIWFSPRFRKLLGYEGSESVTPTMWLSRIHPDDRDDVESAVRRHLLEREPYDVEFRMQTGAWGEYRWYNSRGQGIWADGGEPVRFAGATRDVTERKKLERQLHKANDELELRVQQLLATNEALHREMAERRRVVVSLGQAEEARRLSEASFRSLIEASPDAIIVHRHGQIVYVNPAVLEVLGYERGEDLIGTAPLALMHPEDRPRAGKCIDRLQAGALSMSPRTEQRMIHRDGHLMLVETMGLPVSFEGSPAVMGVVRDITERRRAEEAMRAIEKLAATGRMAARIAHEINNPLAGIKNSFLLIKDAIPTSHPYHSYVGRIEREVERIARIVRQMFDLYLPIRELGPCDVRSVIEDVAALLEVNCRETGIRLRVDAARAGNTVRLAEGSFRQVLYNMVQNAIDASPASGEVRIWAEMQGQNLCVSVQDQGCGIPHDLRSRIFEPFFTTKSGTAGTGRLGLGLAICQSLVQAMRGSLDFESEPGRGTTFRLCLPVDQAAAEPLPEEASA